MDQRHAFTLFELTVVVVIVAIVVVAAMPDAGAEARQESAVAGDLFRTDVQYARSLSLARPDDPVVLKMNLAGNRYWLARMATPEIPITHPQTKKPYVVQFGSNGAQRMKNVLLFAYDLGGDDVLGFDGVGNTDQAAPAFVQLSSGGAAVEVEVQSASAKTVVRTGFTKNLAPPEGGAVVE